MAPGYLAVSGEWREREIAQGGFGLPLIHALVILILDPHRNRHGQRRRELFFCEQQKTGKWVRWGGVAINKKVTEGQGKD